MDANIASVVERIVEQRRHLRLNWAYLARLAHSFGIRRPDSRHPERLRILLHSIPIITLWGDDLGAYTWNRPAIGLPVVVVSHSLGVVVNAYLNVLAAILFGVEEQRVYQRTVDEIAVRATDPTFAESMQAVLERAVGKARGATIDNSAQFDQLYPHLDTVLYAMNAGALNFVLHHEYAHVVFGHLELEASHRVEHEADWFAVKLSGLNECERVGMIAMLMLLIVVDTAAGTPLARSHPLAAARLHQLIAMSEDCDRAAVVSVADAIQHALQPGLKKVGCALWIRVT